MFKRKLTGILHLIRPELTFAAGVCVLAGEILALGHFPQLSVAVLAFLSIFCISASAIILNDLFDYEVDKINTPDRPLPSGAVTRSEVIALSVLTSLAGLACAFILGPDVLVLGIFLWLIAFLYNWRFKQAGLTGNLMVSLSVGLSFIFGALTVHLPGNLVVWIFALIAFFIDLGEEIAGDAMDMEGDRKRGSRSIALTRGRSFALRTSVILWSLVILIGFIPLVFGWLGLTYLVMILATDALIVIFSIRLLRSVSSESGRAAMRGIYLGATLCILAFILSRLFV